MTETWAGGREVMLRQSHAYLSTGGNDGFMHTSNKRIEVFPDLGTYRTSRDISARLSDAASEEVTEPDDADAPLDDAARSERDYVRQRLREELKREPTENELDEWLRQHTEGY
jgi:hypothetical protein